MATPLRGVSDVGPSTRRLTGLPDNGSVPIDAEAANTRRRRTLTNRNMPKFEVQVDNGEHRYVPMLSPGGPDSPGSGAAPDRVDRTAGNAAFGPIDEGPTCHSSPHTDHHADGMRLKKRGSTASNAELLPVGLEGGGNPARTRSAVSTQSEDSLGLPVAKKLDRFRRESSRKITMVTNKHNQNNEASQVGRLTVERLNLAVTYMKDAKIGRQSINFVNPGAVWRYNLYYGLWMGRLLGLVMSVYMGLVIFEKPAVFETPKWITLLVEFICLLFFSYRLREYFLLIGKDNFKKEGKAVATFVVLGLAFLDIVLHLVLTSSEVEALRWSRLLRPVVVVNMSTSRLLRQGFRSVRKTLIEVVNVLVLLLVTIGLFTILFVKLFEKRGLIDKNGGEYFSGDHAYSDGFFQLYVLITTANFPDVMMPAYDFSRISSLFFVLFLLVCMYVFLSIVLAVVYHNYQNYMKLETRTMLRNRRANLLSCYEALVAHPEEHITFAEWAMLIGALHPGYSQGRSWLMWCVLDSKERGYVTRARFMGAVDVLNCGYAYVSSNKNVFHKWFPSVYTSDSSEALKRVVRHRAFRWFFDLLIIITIVCIIFDARDLDDIFVVVFSIEVILKVYTQGTMNFVRNGWNLFDLIIVSAAVIATIVGLYSDDATAVDIILALRVFRLARVMQNYEGFRVIITTILNIGPAISTYGTMVLMVYFVFAIVGMELFGGKIYAGNYDLQGDLFESGSPFYIDLHRGNPKLEGSEFAGDGYFLNNFNDVFSAYITLFELTVVNQWHVLVEGFVLVTIPAAKVYFVVFHIVVVLVIMNIFIAFVLEAFVLEMEMSNTEIEDMLLSKLDDEIERSPSLKEEFSRVELRKSRKLEVLLQHMFDEADGELQDEDESYFEDVSARSRSGNSEVGVIGNDGGGVQLNAATHALDPHGRPSRVVSNSRV